MPTFEYIVAVPYTAESNETLIGKKTIRVLDCSTNVIPSGDCDLFNANLCSTDTMYSNPFIVGDKIYYQYHFSEIASSFFFAYLINIETGLEIPGITIESGKDADLITYRNVIIDTTGFENVNCFQLHIVQFPFIAMTEEEQEEYNQCVIDLQEQGKTLEQAQLICLLDFEEPLATLSSEPYSQIECDQQSILIEGLFPKYDCFGNYYAAFASGSATNSFKSQIRILGEINPVDNNIQITYINNNTRKSAQNFTTHQLRGHQKVPYYVIQKIANIFASQKPMIDEVEYDGSVKLSKNNEQGKMWIIDETLTTNCSNIDFSCS